MVSVIERYLLDERRAALARALNTGLEDAEPHSWAFVWCILAGADGSADVSLPLRDIEPGEVAYGGYPHLAGLGFLLAMNRAEAPSPSRRQHLVDGLQRLRQREGRSLREFSTDDIAILGVAVGLSLAARELDLEEATNWLLAIADREGFSQTWTSRLRQLAADLLDGRKRLLAPLLKQDVESMALEIVLRCTWPEMFRGSEMWSREQHRTLLKQLLTAEIPFDDVEKAAVWLRALDLLVDELCEALLPDHASALVRQLHVVRQKLDEKAERQTSVIVWGVLGALVLALILIGSALYRLNVTWNVLEPWTFVLGLIVSLVTLVYFASTKEELQLSKLRERLLTARRHRLYRDLGLDPDL